MVIFSSLVFNSSNFLMFWFSRRAVNCSVTGWKLSEYEPVVHSGLHDLQVIILISLLKIRDGGSLTSRWCWAAQRRLKKEHGDTRGFSSLKEANKNKEETFIDMQCVFQPELDVTWTGKRIARLFKIAGVLVKRWLLFVKLLNYVISFSNVQICVCQMRFTKVQICLIQTKKKRGKAEVSWGLSCLTSFCFILR